MIVAGTLEVEPGRGEEFVQSRHTQVLESRAEPGCLEYGFSLDPLVPGRVCLFERWETKDALLAHLTRIRATPAPPGPVPVLAAALTQYEVARAGELGS